MIHAIDTDDREAFAKLTPKANNNSKFNVPNGTVIQQTSQHADVSAVHYDAVES